MMSSKPKLKKLKLFECMFAFEFSMVATFDKVLHHQPDWPWNLVRQLDHNVNGEAPWNLRMVLSVRMDDLLRLVSRVVQTRRYDAARCVINDNAVVLPLWRILIAGFNVFLIPLDRKK